MSDYFFKDGKEYSLRNIRKKRSNASISILEGFLYKTNNEKCVSVNGKQGLSQYYELTDLMFILDFAEYANETQSQRLFFQTDPRLLFYEGGGWRKD